MGEVYRAKDPQLGREVALKILLATLAQDPLRLQRFEQEAKAASALNHPGILTVYAFGREQDIVYLATELLEGETLRDRLQAGPVSAKLAADWANQIARALSAAHEKGIIHRDLKPENLFLVRKETLKILDFGLARVERSDESKAVFQDESTVFETSAGTVLGTVGYMAPEQVGGQKADGRTDLFALGVVLYELLTGKNPFRRETPVETLHAILHGEPPDLPENIPLELSRIVMRLLEKSPERRFQSAHDLAFALEGVAGFASSSQIRKGESKTSNPPFLPRVLKLAFLGFGVLGAGFLGLYYGKNSRQPVFSPSVQFEVQPPENALFYGYAETHNIALSPDGETLAFIAESGGTPRLFVRPIHSAQAKALAGTETARSPFWSPDSQTIAFFAGGQLKSIPVQGGLVKGLCELQGTNTGSWGSRGEIIFSQGFGPKDGLFKVPEGGGTAQQIPSAGDLPRWIEFLPDGHRFLYWDRDKDSVEGRLYLGDLDSNQSRELLAVSSQARFAAPHQLLYIQNNILVAHPFDPNKAEFTGDPVPVAANIPHFFNGWSAFSVAGTKAIAYQVLPEARPLVWLDRHGGEIETIGLPGRYLAVRLSPDGLSAVTTLSNPNTTFTDVWVLDLKRGGTTRLSQEPFLEWSPIWSPDSQLIAYTATRPGPQFEVKVRKIEDGSQVYSLDPHPFFLWARSWTNAGIFLDKFDPKTGQDIWQWKVPDLKPTIFMQTEFHESLPSPSPNGKWLAFYTTASGKGEVELVRLDAPGRAIRVSQGARGFLPRWRADSGELFYISASGWMTSISVSGTAMPVLGDPDSLFPLEVSNEDGFDVDANGTRFLVSTTRPNSVLPITITTQWTQHIQKP
ncbi:MAG: serine/threonine-protein kinase [Acidobacteria bacterium]|nr:serine/threonine-protein kinase [Acidobacteriota bacterium]